MSTVVPPSRQASTSGTRRWEDSDKRSSRKAKGTRNILRKASGVESPHTSSSPQPSSSEHRASPNDKDASGFFPRLGRILDGRETKTTRRPKSSTSGSLNGHPPVRHRARTVDDAALARRGTRQKHTSLQRRAESLASLPNPSLISVLSSLTQHSTASSGSNSTITQQSYNRSHITKRKAARDRKRVSAKDMSEEEAPPPATAPSNSNANVFQYLNDSLTLTAEQFPHAPSSDDDADAEAPPRSPAPASLSTPEQGTPRSSPVPEESTANLRRPANSARPPAFAESDAAIVRVESAPYQEGERLRSDSGICIRGHSPNADHMARGQYRRAEEEVVHAGAGEQEGEDESEESSDEEDSEAQAYDGQHPAQQLTYQPAVAAPQRLPSATSSRHSDRRARRLREQEQELREHVLQPMPKRDFRFEVGSPLYPSAAMPPAPYDMQQPEPGGPPMQYYAQAPHPAAWPPAAPPIGYSSPTYAPPGPYSTGAEQSYALTTQAPMPVAAPPSSSVEQTPAYYAHPQSQLYHPQPPGPDLTRTTKVGYELLADKLSQVPSSRQNASGNGAVVPMYRKFEQLNHRVLLHLQDEIAELEEELRQLDERIAQSTPRNEAGQLQPASRRSDGRYGGDVQYKRTELLGRIFLKLGQYSMELGSCDCTETY